MLKQIGIVGLILSFMLFPLNTLLAVPPSGSATDTTTGITTHVQGHEGGGRTVTRTDADGNVIEKYDVPPPRPGRAEGEVRHPDGSTTHAVKEPGGPTVVTKRDASGNVTSTETIPPPGTQPPSGTGFDPGTGVTTHVVGLPGGGREVTRTGPDGKVISKEKVDVPGQPYEQGSSTNPETGVKISVIRNPSNGNITTIKDHPDGRREIKVTDKFGQPVMPLPMQPMVMRPQAPPPEKSSGFDTGAALGTGLSIFSIFGGNLIGGKSKSESCPTQSDE